jgi:hypothetical protein
MHPIVSFWHVTHGGPQHGQMLRKLERLAGFTAVAPMVERLVWEGRKEAHVTFEVHHATGSHEATEAALLALAWQLAPTWRITRASGDLEGEWSQSAVGPDHPFEAIIAGCTRIRWQLHPSQQYTRPNFLGGGDNHW